MDNMICLLCLCWKKSEDAGCQVARGGEGADGEHGVLQAERHRGESGQQDWGAVTLHCVIRLSTNGLDRPMR